jgi:hypothetical protein
MIFKTILFFISIFLVSASFASQATPKIINLSESLQSYVEKSRKLDSEARVLLFEKLVINPHAAAFQKLVFRGSSTKDFLKKWLPKAEPNFESAIKLAKEFGPIFDTMFLKYKEIFPKADFHYSIYLMPSFTFDGRADELSDGTILVAFGIDRLTRYKKEDIKIVVAHEMFHALQMQTFKSQMNKSLALSQLWHEVWVEGLATYASGVMTGAKMAADVLGKKNIEGCRLDLAKEKIQLLKNLDRKTVEIADLMDRWFGGHQFAYCLGYMAVRDLAKDQSLASMLNWELSNQTRSKLEEKIKSTTTIDN